MPLANPAQARLLLRGVKGSYWGMMSGALVLTLIDSLLRAAGLEQAYQLIMFSVIPLLLIAVYGRLRSLPSSTMPFLFSRDYCGDCQRRGVDLPST